MPSAELITRPPPDEAGDAGVSASGSAAAAEPSEESGAGVAAFAAAMNDDTCGAGPGAGHSLVGVVANSRSVRPAGGEPGTGEGPATASIDDLREALTTHEELARTARRVLGSAHPVTTEIELRLPHARAALRAREGASS